MQLTSTVFENGKDIPKRHTGDGENLSPPLRWSGAPEGTQSFALICEDPDAPKSKELGHPFVHWLIYNIPDNTTALPEGIDTKARVALPVSADQGSNSFEALGYAGPLPPRGHGVHHYIFTLYALDKPFAAPPGSDRKALVRALEGHVIAKAQLIGLFERALEVERANPSPSQNLQ